MYAKKLPFILFLLIGVSGLFTPLTAQTIIRSDTADYDILFRDSGSLSSFHSGSTSLNVSITDFSGFIVEYYRTILQFDISELTEPVTSATFYVYKEASGGSDFDVDLYGSTLNRSDFIHASESSSTDEFFNSSGRGYFDLDNSTDPFIYSTDPDFEWYSIDITDFINNRISDYQSGGDSVVVLKLRPDGSYSTGGTNYNFASGNDGNGYEPYLAVYQDDAQQAVSGNEGWRMLSSPINNARVGNLTSALWTQGFSGADEESGAPNIYTWTEGDGDQDTTARGFTSAGDADQVLGNGEGVIAYVYEDDDPEQSGVDGGFPKTLDANGVLNSGTVGLPVTLTSEAGNYVAARDGWNLVGNPYDAPIDWDASGWTKTNIDQTIYVWSESSGNYLTWNGLSGTLTNGEIAAFQGFWVKANGSSPELTATESVQTSSATFYKDKETFSEVKFTLEGNQMESETVFLFTRNGETAKDPFDAYKLQPLSSNYLTLFSVLEDGSPMDMQVLPDRLEEGFSVDVGVSGTVVQGDFSLSWDQKNLPAELGLFLVDHKTGSEVDLTKESKYYFEMDKEAQSKSADVLMKPLGRLYTSSPVLTHKKNKGVEKTRFSIQVKQKTSVGNEKNEMPLKFSLGQNYPNPFNPATEIKYELAEQNKVTLTIYNVMGQQVETLVSGTKSAGTYRVSWDAGNMASGIYYYRLQAGNQVVTRQMTLIK